MQRAALIYMSFNVRPLSRYRDNFWLSKPFGLDIAGLDRNNKGVKYTQTWNSAGHNCRNRKRLCANVLSIASFRALQVCA